MDIPVIVFVLVLAIYFLPTILADLRNYDSKFLLFLVNLVFGWTIIGWLGCIYLVFDGSDRWN